ncbi:hypothetical protein QYM36_019212 [Artemia franciscana]|uniref:PiggyBac transposable element-derived protein domain-containing protein n=1 Tax=Artemia franciscana TaxID=6661 RepID=A0AA88H880_ARTSF|nr:hypothetical protein QYM36_019212 [Artemia franciscana]
MTKCHDNKLVHLISSFARPDPSDQRKRWDKKSQAKIDANRSHVGKDYDKFMGRVDLSDMLIELYRTDIKGKKWFMCLIYYCLDLTVANDRLLYRHNHHSDTEKSLPLVHFCTDIADLLLRSAIVHAMRKKIMMSDSVPSFSVHYDRLAHWCEVVGERQRCQSSAKHAFTFVKCLTCTFASLKAITVSKIPLKSWSVQIHYLADEPYKCHIPRKINIQNK